MAQKGLRDIVMVGFQGKVKNFKHFWWCPQCFKIAFINYMSNLSAGPNRETGGLFSLTMT
jgi:hypothetical protein